MINSFKYIQDATAVVVAASDGKKYDIRLKTKNKIKEKCKILDVYIGGKLLMPYHQGFIKTRTGIYFFVTVTPDGYSSTIQEYTYEDVKNLLMSAGKESLLKNKFFKEVAEYE